MFNYDLINGRIKTYKYKKTKNKIPQCSLIKLEERRVYPFVKWDSPPILQWSIYSPLYHKLKTPRIPKC